MSRAWEQFRDADVGLPPDGATSRARGVGRAFGARGFLAQRREDIATCAAKTSAAVISAVETLASARTRADVIDAIARILVPSIADWSVIFERGPRLDSRPAVAATYPLCRDRSERLGSLSSVAVQARLGVVGAVATGRAQRSAESVFGPRADTAGDVSAQGDCVGSLVPFEVVSHPIVVGDSVRVVVTLARTRAGAPFRHADVELSAKVCTLAGERLNAIQRESP